MTFQQRGLTLVEMLVVMIIVSMIAGILLQALEQIFHINARFNNVLIESQQGAMLSDWFRQTIEGLVTDYSDGKNIFKGESNHLQGLTTNPLDVDYGAPTPLDWQIVRDTNTGEYQLMYHVFDRKNIKIFGWKGSKGRFIYVDEKGEEHDVWPPPLGQWPQIPNTIFLETSHLNGEERVVAVPRGPTTLLPRPRNPFQNQ